MRRFKCFDLCLLLACTTLLFQVRQGEAQQNSGASSANEPAAARDGQHDFDFEIGLWKTHLKVSSRLRRPFTGPETWSEYNGTTFVRKIWNGRANMAELEVDGPGGHLEGASLRLYNPESHQWSLNFANSDDGIEAVPTVGEFKNSGYGEFYDHERIHGRMTLVRNVWSDITPTSCRFEQAFSDDGGKTWETNWIAVDTRVTSESAMADTTLPNDTLKQDGQHDFDFSLGTWKIHIKQLQHPLTGSSTWVEYDGTSVVRKVWNGRGSMAETEADGTAGHIQALGLHLYNPAAHQWNLTYASSQGGILSPASSGRFKDGRGEFIDTEPFNGKNILVRQVWSDVTPTSCHFEQAFSEDGGKTWEVNFIATDTRVGDESAKAQ